MVYEFNMKKNHSLEELQNESARILSKYPDRIPIIIEKNVNCKNLPELTKQKFLVPKDLTMSQFMYIIRKRIKLNEAEALFIFTADEQLVPGSTKLLTVYDEHKDDSGFIFLIISAEQTFGKKS
jgi:GABA(A) receptor-associated protein